MNKKIIIILIVVLLIGLGIFFKLKAGKKVQNLTIEQVQEKYAEELMNIDGVVGVAISECDNEPCISVLLENDSEELKNKIPTELQGYKVKTEVTGPFEALD